MLATTQQRTVLEQGSDVVETRASRTQLAACWICSRMADGRLARGVQRRVFRFDKINGLWVILARQEGSKIRMGNKYDYSFKKS